MHTDKYGQQIYSEQDLCDLIMKNPELTLNRALTSTAIRFDPALEIENAPKLIEYVAETMSVEEFDERNQATWYLPPEYRNFDIAKYVLALCDTDEELQRAGEELILYQERDMFIVLRYLKYLVDLMRQNNIVWGVGRGSSVSSFVLYLIGVHKINSLFYQLDIEEFLK
jgi:DNA polymerase III alpha subunit